MGPDNNVNNSENITKGVCCKFENTCPSIMQMNMQPEQIKLITASAINKLENFFKTGYNELTPSYY